jgi:exopolyphosphatase / guanosine-5'-triphosphate,3'-diphosphate pyrophosphatase
LSGSTRIGVVDIGTNSTRLLVGDVEDGAVVELERRTVVTRLGEGVDATGRLSDAAMDRVTETLAGYREVIDRLGAENVVAVATSAMRDAENGPAFRERLLERFDIDARTISGDEEARLTFLGATAQRVPASGGADRDESGGSGADRDESGGSRAEGSGGSGAGRGEVATVIDIGGGSTEYVTGREGSEPDFHVSTRMGSVRHSERFLKSDPPEHDELTGLSTDAERIIEDAVPPEVRERTGRLIAVAGTATSLAAIDQELDPYDPDKVHRYRLSLAACERMLAMLASLRLEERRRVTGLHPDRAPTIVAGAVILAESIRAFGLDAVEISEADILHGAALDAAEAAAATDG